MHEMRASTLLLTNIIGGTKTRQFSAASASHHIKSSGRFSNIFCNVEISLSSSARLTRPSNAVSRARSRMLVAKLGGIFYFAIFFFRILWDLTPGYGKIGVLGADDERTISPPIYFNIESGELV